MLHYLKHLKHYLIYILYIIYYILYIIYYILYITSLHPPISIDKAGQFSSSAVECVSCFAISNEALLILSAVVSLQMSPSRICPVRPGVQAEMAAKTMRFVYFAASGAAGIHFGRAAGARRLQKAGLEAPEAPQDSAKRPKGRPLGDQRVPKETPGRAKWRPSSSKGRFLEHFGGQNAFALKQWFEQLDL